MLNTTLLKLNKTPILLVIFSLTFYGFFAYNLERADYTKLIILYSALFILFYFLLKNTKLNFKFLVAVAFLIRLVFLLAIPNLSQDFYRFIWDGNMILEGVNPYLYTPESFMLKGETPVENARQLFFGMGKLNASHFTNYPPLNQLCFVIANLFPGKSILSSVIGLRLLIIAADFGTLYFGKKLLEKLNIPVKNIFWYILNPFIIIELTGNLHFEAVMIFFIIWSLYLLHIGKWKVAAVVFACSISVKLIPLIFLPLLFCYFISDRKTSQVLTSMTSALETCEVSVKKLIPFYTIVGITTLLLFLPFYNSEFITNYSKTIGLWFGNYEFNASIYYALREVSFYITGYNEIANISKLLPILVVLFVLYLAFFRRNYNTKQLITSMLFAFAIYLFLSTTVHPWYLATLLILGVFTNYKFPLVWSFVIILSYLVYTNANNSENLWIIGLEYLIVFSSLLFDLLLKKTSY